MAIIVLQRKCPDCDEQNGGEFNRIDCGCCWEEIVGEYDRLQTAILRAGCEAKRKGTQHGGTPTGSWWVVDKERDEEMVAHS